ncbi:MAG TPA: biotin--[acetyl-CoA-carboxylase] ligase [candidate division Zixibacteria bacterium]
MVDLLSNNAEKVLKVLKRKKGRFLATRKIAASAGLSSFNVYQSIYHLQSWEYQIESQKGKGYRLVKPTDLLLPFEIKDNLHTKFLGQKIHSYQTLKSTNLLAYKLAEAGSPEGAIVISEKQTAGKGRMGREWFSPSKVGLWMSLVLRPDIPPSKAAGLSLCAGLALAQTIQNLFGLKAKIKWPNDCLINGKKVAGILLELSAEIDQIRFVIMGVGININQKRSDFPSGLQDKATSIRIELGQRVRRLDTLKSFLEKFEKIYLVFRKKGLGTYRQDIKKYSSVLNKEIRIKSGDEVITGKAYDIDDNGSLVIKTKDGTRAIITGEVNLL